MEGKKMDNINYAKMRKTLLFILSIIVNILCLSVRNAYANYCNLPEPTEDSAFYDNGAPDMNKVNLGKLLFFDKILSGNKNISCATCHHPMTDTGDSLSLPVGEGGRGLGMMREPLNIGDYLIINKQPRALGGIRERVPRNAPPLWNLGAKEFTRMFHDGRVEVDSESPSGFRTPAGDNLPDGLDNVLATQAMFPVTSLAEMAGQVEDNNPDNEIAPQAAAGNLTGPGGVWDLLAVRLGNIPEYVDLFQAAFPDISTAEEITFVHAANAIAAYEAFSWRADDTPFDRYLSGQKNALTSSQRRGMYLFYHKAKCHTCHSGVFQTDHNFHAIAMPQIGPGRGGVEPEDIGRAEVSGVNGPDRYKFRTPSLRNVVLNAPYGHGGAYDRLEDVVFHHLNPINAFNSYDWMQVRLPSQNRPDLFAQDFAVLNNPLLSQNIKNANELEPADLTEKEFYSLIEFLHALTDLASLDISNDVPFSVPSGLTVTD
jgi:cytochrome c peroxidase